MSAFSIVGVTKTFDDPVFELGTIVVSYIFGSATNQFEKIRRLASRPHPPSPKILIQFTCDSSTPQPPLADRRGGAKSPPKSRKRDNRPESSPIVANQPFSDGLSIQKTPCMRAFRDAERNFLCIGDSGAEGVGFEPTRDFHPCRFSSSRESHPPVSKLSDTVHYSVHRESHCPPRFIPLVVKVVVSPSLARVWMVRVIG